MSVDAVKFYAEYHGHPVPLLQKVHDKLRAAGNRMIFLAGDSSLDNKHWLFPGLKDARALQDDAVAAPAVPQFAEVLRPPRMAKDVAYWMNKKLEGTKSVCINAAIEESTVGERDGKLMPQDEFIRDNLTSEDTVVVSLGGNDIALKPSPGTIFNIGMLKMVGFESWINSAPQKSAWLRPWGLQHFVTLFKTDIERYLHRVCAKNKPKRILVCMIYHPCELGTGWADTTLSALGYNSKPSWLQSLIKAVFELATKQIKIDGVEVVPIPLFQVLDPKDGSDYLFRVEPSSTGGMKMAEAFLPHL
mmetsp:Transcript_15112/g.36472  ORF Transcript_15112/g.36472 Transcript_15112/m.36472 type:complete len:303 (-) Transcript_15112:188-1096(-)